jgi:hypothetical protein
MHRQPRPAWFGGDAGWKKTLAFFYLNGMLSWGFHYIVSLLERKNAKNAIVEIP